METNVRDDRQPSFIDLFCGAGGFTWGWVTMYLPVPTREWIFVCLLPLFFLSCGAVSLVPLMGGKIGKS